MDLSVNSGKPGMQTIRGRRHFTSDPEVCYLLGKALNERNQAFG